jgi:hypothetical protein
MNNEVIFDYLRYACFYYVPSKPNRKKIKELIYAIPYFVKEKYQSILFDIIHNNPIESYWDTTKSMNEYGYIIYKEFHIQTQKETNQRIKAYPEYINDLNTPYNDSEYKRKRTHHILFFIILSVLIYCLYYVLKD